MVSYLKQRQQYVIVNEEKSEECVVTSGVSQDFKLGPSFFFIYMNDLHETIN